MNKTKTVSVRVTDGKYKEWKQAAQESKNLSAFFISSISRAWKYRNVLDQAEELGKKYKISAMKVRVE